MYPGSVCIFFLPIRIHMDIFHPHLMMEQSSWLKIYMMSSCYIIIFIFSLPDYNLLILVKCQITFLLNNSHAIPNNASYNIVI